MLHIILSGMRETPGIFYSQIGFLDFLFVLDFSEELFLVRPYFIREINLMFVLLVFKYIVLVLDFLANKVYIPPPLFISWLFFNQTNTNIFYNQTELHWTKPNHKVNQTKSKLNWTKLNPNQSYFGFDWVEFYETKVNQIKPKLNRYAHP